jgi:RecB family endonuclease NucS
MIFVKPDNAFHLHQPLGTSPVHWIKPGAEIVLQKSDKHLSLKIHHVKTKEFVDIEIFRVYNFMSHKLEDGAKAVLFGNEKDMSDMIKDNPELISKDFKPSSREEHTKFGFIDVFGHDQKGNLIIVECKRYSAGLDAVTQLRRYVEKIKDLKGTKNVQGFLAAPAISPNALELMKKLKFEFKEVHPPKRMERWNKNQKKLDGW